MARSTIFLIIMVALTALGALGTLALTSPIPATSSQTLTAPTPSTTPDVSSATSAAATVNAQALAQTLLQLRQREASLLQTLLQNLPPSTHIARWLDPSLAARPRLPLPRPDLPPSPYPSFDLPDDDALSRQALASLTEVAESAQLSLLSLSLSRPNLPAKTLSAPAAHGLTLDAALPWLATQPTTKPAHGVLKHGDKLFDVIAVPSSHAGGTLWVIAALPIDLPRYQLLLPPGASLLALYDSKPVGHAGAIDATQIKALTDGLAALAPSAPNTPAPGPSSASLTSALLPLPACDASPSPLSVSLLISTPTAALAVAATAPAPSPPDAAAPPAPASALARIQSSPLLTQPTQHLPVLISLLLALITLPLLGRWLISIDLRASLLGLTRRINVDEPLNRIDLRPFERQLLDATIARHAPRAAAAPQATPISATQEQRLRSENEQMRQDLDSAQSHARQVEKQLEFARKKIQDTSEEARLATTNSIALQNQLTALQNQLASLQSQPQSSGSPSNSQENPSTRRPPPPKPGQTPPNRSGANKSSAVPSASSVSSANPKDFDTAEVSNEDMSHLLDGGFDSTASPTLPPNASISELAQQIGSMSPSQIAKIPDAPALKSPRSSTDPAKITAMGLPRAELIPNFPTPHQPGISEEARRASAKNPKEEEDYGLTERIDRASLRLDIPSKPKPGDKPAPSKPSPLQTQPLSSGLFSADDDITVSTPDSAVPPSPSASNTSNANIRPRRPSLASAPQALSPAGLLEALKRRGQQEPLASPNPNPDPTTRITPMSITRELLDQSRPEAPPDTLSHSGVFSRTGSKLDIEPANDSEYFKALYEDFLATKRTCGESTDNITMERFVNRLARNKQALVDRYNCGTVRFQVYVKDGRAALKATPVK
jgi:hypothetical protein